MDMDIETLEVEAEGGGDNEPSKATLEKSQTLDDQSRDDQPDV